MWILPNNHPLSSTFAQDYADSNEELKEYFQNPEPPLMWKSKPLSVKTFSLQWKRVWWLRHLSGRTLKPSTRDRFEVSLTSYLEGTRVSHFHLPVTEKAFMTQDTFGRLYTELQKQLDLFAVSSKTSQGTLAWDMTKFTAAFEIWVTALRQESIQRRKLAHRMNGNAFSYLQSWGTPRVATNGMIGYEKEQSQSRVEDQVVNWRTPMASDFGGTTREDFSPKLSEQIRNWSTPDANLWKGAVSEEYLTRKDGKSRLDRLQNQVVHQKWPTPTTMDKMDPKTDKAIHKEVTEIRPGRSTFANLRDAVARGTMTDFRQGKGRSSLNGKSRARLNPAWSIQLMGTTLQKIFTVPLATQWSNKPQN
jgi:hypothetical protein